MVGMHVLLTPTNTNGGAAPLMYEKLCSNGDTHSIFRVLIFICSTGISATQLGMTIARKENYMALKQR